MKKYLIVTVFLVVLFTASSAVLAANIDVKGDLRVTFDLNQFVLDRLALKWNAALSTNNGVEGEFRFGSSTALPESVYFYQKGLFQRADVLQVGHFPITWSAEKSATIIESLADALEPANGTGVKYQIGLDEVSIASSLSGGTPTESRLDLAVRVDFPVLSDLNLGVGLSSVSSTADRKSIVVDAIYKPNRFQVLGEFVTESSAGNDWQSGFYVEGAFSIAPKFQAYAGICQAPNLRAWAEWIVLGGKYKMADNIALQGEYQSHQNKNNIILSFQVDF